jgi:hypothetical protein
MDPNFQSIVQESKVLSEDMRAKLLKVGPSLTPEQIQAILERISVAEADLEAQTAPLEEQKQTLNAEFVNKARMIQKQALPKALHAMENVERESEEAELDSILADLDKL